MADFPLILAGPILRRVDADIVAVWIALSEPRQVKLSLFLDRAKVVGTLELPPEVKSDSDPIVGFSSPARTTIRVGDNLHVAVATIRWPEDPAPAAMKHGQIYCYNLSFAPIDSPFAVTEDLRSEGLLEERVGPRPHRPLGYQLNVLPSFATCPLEITDLEVVHGSCRRINADLEDGLAWVDGFIEKERLGTGKRPHQLMLSGDQIYADDVPVVLGTQLRDRGIELMGSTEFLPMRWSSATTPPAATMRPVDARHLPTGMRHRLIDTEARMTSKDKHSHLISFGEFCAMYLFVWSNELWDIDALEDFDDALIGFGMDVELPPNWGSLFKKHAPVTGDQLTDIEVKSVVELLVELHRETVRRVLRSESRGSFDVRRQEGFLVDALHPAGLILERLLSDRITTDTADLARTAREFTEVQQLKPDAANLAQLDAELLDAIDGASRDEFVRVVQCLFMPKVTFGGIDSFTALHEPFRSKVLELCRGLAAGVPEFSPIFAAARAVAFPDGFSEIDEEALWRFQQVVHQMIEDYGGLFENVLSVDKRKSQVRKFYARLPEVRRALANVPTYMIFDDHEVTDDWNLSQSWKNRVYVTPLGRTILRNGLAAYGVFQGWGNDPLKFGEPGANKDFLDLVPTIVPPGQTPGSSPEPESPTTTRLDRILGLAKVVEEHDPGLDPDHNPIPDPEPRVDWHYQVDGARHRTFVLDNRTRRTFADLISPPGNIGQNSIRQQLPIGPRPAGIEVIFVVAPLTVMGAPLIDDLIAPTSFRAFDALSQQTIDGLPGTNPDAVEAWAFSPELMEDLLKQASSWDRVVFLSGDVHHGESNQMSYWAKDSLEPARFAQFTSSGMRNVLPSYLGTLSRTFGFMQRLARARIDVVRFGWDTDSPALLTNAQIRTIAPSLRSRMNTSPVLLPRHGVPDGTDFARPPDWRWRMDVVVDRRLEADRPESTHIGQLTEFEEFGVVDGDLAQEYHRLAARHASLLDQVNHGRQIMFTNNLGVVTFTIDNPGTPGDPATEILTAVHELWATPPSSPDGSDTQGPEAFARHVVALRATDEPLPTFAATGVDP